MKTKTERLKDLLNQMKKSVVIDTGSEILSVDRFEIWNDHALVVVASGVKRKRLDPVVKLTGKEKRSVLNVIGNSSQHPDVMKALFSGSGDPQGLSAFHRGMKKLKEGGIL